MIGYRRPEIELTILSNLESFLTHCLSNNIGRIIDVSAIKTEVTVISLRGNVDHETGEGYIYTAVPIEIAINWSQNLKLFDFVNQKT